MYDISWKYMGIYIYICMIDNGNLIYNGNRDTKIWVNYNDLTATEPWNHG